MNSVKDFNLQEFNSLDSHSKFCLRRSGINTVEDLLSISVEELKKIRGLGKVTLKKILNVKSGLLPDNWCGLEDNCKYVLKRRVTMKKLISFGFNIDSPFNNKFYYKFPGSEKITIDYKTKEVTLEDNIREDLEALSKLKVLLANEVIEKYAK